MKHTLKLLFIVTVCPTLLLAQGRRGGMGRAGRGGGAMGAGRGGPVQMDEREALDLVALLLNLTDPQKQQLQTIFDAAEKIALPAATQLQASSDSLFEAVKAGKTDDEIRSIAAQQGSLRTQILTLQAQTFSKLWGILNADQKAEANSFVYDAIGDFLSYAPPPPPAAPLPAAAPVSP
jgi:Spy/CpxP family protein refolding chaperone